MIVIDSHITPPVKDKIRFVDYCIGVFPQLMTKNSIKKAIKRKELMMNGELASSGHWMCENDEIYLVDAGDKLPKHFPLEIPIVFEDDFIVIVNKPSGITVNGNQYRTVENAMVGKISLSNQEDANRWAKPVHRLDHATSGLLILSKTATAHRLLAKMFEEKKIIKEYHAVVMGKFPLEKGSVVTPTNGQDSHTDFVQIKTIPSLRSDELSLLKLFPKTGRTHQLRIHCAENGCPIVGDTLYGEEENTLLHKGLFLASTCIEFLHPMTNEVKKIEIDIPYKFKSLIEREERRWRKFKS